MLVLELLQVVQEEQVVLEEPKDYQQKEGCVQSAHVNHQYHHHNHHATANHYYLSTNCLVAGYQTVATPLIAMQGYQDLM